MSGALTRRAALAVPAVVAVAGAAGLPLAQSASSDAQLLAAAAAFLGAFNEIAALDADALDPAAATWDARRMADHASRCAAAFAREDQAAEVIAALPATTTDGIAAKAVVLLRSLERFHAGAIEDRTADAHSLLAADLCRDIERLAGVE
jgi:hypothetical protein